MGIGFTLTSKTYLVKDLDEETIYAGTLKR